MRLINRCYFIQVSNWYLRYESLGGYANTFGAICIPINTITLTINTHYLWSIVNVFAKKLFSSIWTANSSIPRSRCAFHLLHLYSHLAGYIPRFGAIWLLIFHVGRPARTGLYKWIEKQKKSSVMLPKMQVRWLDLLAAVMNDMVMISTMVKFTHCVY